MGLGTLDIAVLVTYFATILGVGLWFGRKERNTEDYFLGGRSQHWLIVGLSILATELSALTFVSVPGTAFLENWSYLQLYVGAFVGRLLVAYLLLPAFYGGSVTTVYEYLGQRFGPATRTTASIMFVLSRLLGSGIRLLAASIAISVVFGWSLNLVIVLSAMVAIVYTTFGGIRAIIATDALQALIFIGGAVAVILYLILAIPGGPDAALETANNAGKFHIFTVTGSLNNERLFWVLLINATILNMASMGTDQDMTQRMLTCPDLKKGQRSIIFNAILGLPTVCLFLLIGALLFSYFQAFPNRLPETIADKPDRVFPYFIANALPAGYGLRGLLVAGVFAAAMSSLDSALGALSSTAVTDLIRPYRRTPLTEHQALQLARLLTVGFGAGLAVLAIAFSNYDQLLWQAFKFVGLVFGGMLGVFLLGVLTRQRGNDFTNPAAMVSSFVILVALMLYQNATQKVIIAWPWWVVLGTTWTFVVGLMFRTDPKQSEIQ